MRPGPAKILLRLGPTPEVRAAKAATDLLSFFALALMGMTARSPALLGDRDSARRHYRRLLVNWRSADPGIPDLKEARAFSEGGDR
jgi:hypothetical protein